jgi:hypothetical protein
MFGRSAQLRGLVPDRPSRTRRLSLMRTTPLALRTVGGVRGAFLACCAGYALAMGWGGCGSAKRSIFGGDLHRSLRKRGYLGARAVRRLSSLASLALVACQTSVCPAAGTCTNHVAIDLTIVDAATGGPIRAVVAVSGRRTDTVQCDGTCSIFGYSGMYVLDVTATGLAPVHRIVQVHGIENRCSCETTQVEHITVAMVGADSAAANAHAPVVNRSRGMNAR